MSLVGPETQNVPMLCTGYQFSDVFRTRLVVGFFKFFFVAQSFLFFKIISESKCKKNDGFSRFKILVVLNRSVANQIV